MKRYLAYGLMVIFTFTLAAGSAWAQNAYYTGDGGKGKSITILPPKATGLAADQAYIPGVVQGELVSNFSGYSAISVLDRLKLDDVYDELLSGYYDENAEASGDLGRLAPTEYIMGGSITKTASGYALQLQITKTADKMTAASYSGTCTYAELETLSGIRRASLDLLQKMGVQPTERTKTELGEAASANQAAAQVALSKGIEAMKNGTVVEALSYFIQSSNADPQLAEAASRVNITTASITSGNIGEDTRNEIAWRKAWVARLAECDAYVADYVNTAPFTAYLAYSTNLQKGEIDWDKETIPISFQIALYTDRNWPAPVKGVVDAVYSGLAATGRAAAWKLDWPAKTPSGGVKTTAARDVGVQLLNDQGQVIGSQTVSLTAGWETGFANGKTTTKEISTIKTVKFPAVDANKITDRLTIKVASLNGMSVEAAAKKYSAKINILTQADYIKLGRSSGWFGPAGGEVIVVNGQKLEVAPANTEFEASWSDAIARCKSLKVNGIGGWRLPTKEELNAMYIELKKQGRGGFSDDWYWSSSEHAYGSYDAWVQRFSDGLQKYNGKYGGYSVRAVLDF